MDSATLDWTDPRFLDEAGAWIRTQLVRTGAQLTGRIAQQHVQAWATVMRVPTDRGDMYFKANHDALRHEAAVANYLSQRRPDFVTPPLAVDIERGWLLMEDAGLRLRELIARDRTLDPWLELLPRYAGLQLDLAESNEDLLAFGLPDMRAPVLVPRFEAALDRYEAEAGTEAADILDRARRHVPRIVEMSHELAAVGIPETIQHDDLNDGQVYVRDGQYALLDWGDACISHPFFSMSVALEGVVSWGVDDIQNSVDIDPFLEVYLQPFADRLGKTIAELRSAAASALRLGWACRTANGYAQGDPDHNRQHLEMLLDGRVNE